MNVSLNYFIYASLILGGLGSVTLAALSFRRQNPSATVFSLLMLAVANWMLTDFIYLSIPTFAPKLFWYNASAISVIFVPCLWFLFAVVFTSRPAWLVTLAYWMFLPATVLLALLWTNNFHQLYYQSFQLYDLGRFSALVFDQAPLAWFQIVYSYAMTMIGTLIIWQGGRNLPIMYQQQSRMLAWFALLPWFANLLSITNLTFIRGLDLTPLGFILSGIPILQALWRFRLFEMVPVARELIFDSLSNAVLVFDKYSNLVDVNSAGLRFLERPLAEVLGLPAKEALVNYPEIAFFSQQTTTVQTEFEVLIQDKMVHFQVISKPLEDAKKNVTGYIVVVQDVTTLRQAEIRAVEAQNAAEQANRAKSAFLANISHEIRTPLNAVLGLSELLLLDTNLTPKQTDSLYQIYASGNTLIRLLNDLLDISKIESGKLELENTLYDPVEVLTNTCQMFAGRAQEKGLNYYIDTDLPPAGIGDPTRLQQILGNLLSNAIKFTHSGSVTTTARLISQTPNYFTLAITVEDTGMGIDPTQQQAIFDPFIQASRSITREYGGTGLGLAISRQLVQMSGGEMKVESRTGFGSRFSFTIQLQTAPEEAPFATGTLRKSPSLAGLRVLVAEDNPINQKVLLQMLERQGCLVTIVGNGRTAVSVSAHQDFDVLLMDIQMPELDGVSAAKEIRLREQKSGQHLSIIALTANAMAGERERCTRAGMDDYLTKPLQTKLLYEALRKLTVVAADDNEPAEPDSVPSGFGGFQWKELLNRCGDDAELALELLGMFHDQWPDTFNQLQTALNEQDAPTLEEVAHKLKGSAATLTASEMALHAETLQQMGQHAELGNAQQTLDKLTESYKQLKLEIACQTADVSVSI
jgi:PAS domain S-box-containing protein